MSPPSAPPQSRRLRTYRYRIHPTRRQVDALESQLAFAADLYNAALQERRDAWRRGVSVNFNAQSRELTEYRREGGERPEAMSALVQHEVLRRVDRAFAAFFRRCKTGEKPGYPRFRSKRRYDSLTFTLSHGNTNGAGEIRGGRFRLVGLGDVKVRWHRPIPEDAIARSAIVRRSCGRWYVSIALELPAAEAPTHGGPAVGLDLGVASFATLSTGEQLAGPGAGRAAHRRVRRLARTVARRKRGPKGRRDLDSRRRRKAVAQLARAREHEANVRRDHRAKLANRLASRYSLIAVEDLELVNMTRSARGTLEAPGQRVRQKAGLNRSELDQAGGFFLTTLRSKAEEAGSVVVEVDPKHTSQTCHRCGTIDPRSRPSQAVFACVACGHVDHADVNAARNILRLGQSQRAATVEIAHAVARGRPPASTPSNLARRGGSDDATVGSSGTGRTMPQPDLLPADLATGAEAGGDATSGV